MIINSGILNQSIFPATADRSVQDANALQRFLVLYHKELKMSPRQTVLTK